MTAAAATLSSTLDLHADNITIKFGGLVAVDDVSFTIPHGSVVSLIGPNGAGKTTYFNVLTGLYHPTSGRVYLGDEDVTGLSPHLVAHKGLARTFQNIRLFNLMTAEENVMVAMHSHMKSGIVETVLKTPRQRREEREARERAHELLTFVDRALALKPKVLLLDEPTAGMNPQESARFVEFVHHIRDEMDVSVLLIEHDMSVVMKVSERITVLDRGRKIAEGTPDEIKNDQNVVEAYLGKTGTDGYRSDK
jgi:branched-chain amino acid transport system ATP-binding protein